MVPPLIAVTVRSSLSGSESLVSTLPVGSVPAVAFATPLASTAVAVSAVAAGASFILATASVAVLSTDSAVPRSSV